MGQWHGGNCRSGGRLRDRPSALAFLPILTHTSHMNKTTQPDLPLILADYTEFVIQQQRRWAAMRAEVGKTAWGRRGFLRVDGVSCGERDEASRGR